jgi:transposase InsO family protein
MKNTVFLQGKRTLALRGILISFTRPGKPTDKSHIESFNGQFRDECLNAHFLSVPMVPVSVAVSQQAVSVSGTRYLLP